MLEINNRQKVPRAPWLSETSVTEETRGAVFVEQATHLVDPTHLGHNFAVYL